MSDWHQLPHVVRDNDIANIWYPMTSVCQYFRVSSKQCRRHMKAAVILHGADSHYMDKASFQEIQRLKQIGGCKLRAVEVMLVHQVGVESMAKSLMAHRDAAPRDGPHDIDGPHAATHHSDIHDIDGPNIHDIDGPRDATHHSDIHDSDIHHSATHGIDGIDDGTIANDHAPHDRIVDDIDGTHDRIGPHGAPHDIGPHDRIAAKNRVHPRAGAPPTVEETLAKLRHPRQLSLTQLNKVRLLHKLVPIKCGRVSKWSNLVKAASSIVISGTTGKRSGTTMTRVTNKDLEGLGVFEEVLTEFQGPYGVLLRPVIKECGEEVWERAMFQKDVVMEPLPVESLPVQSLPVQSSVESSVESLPVQSSVKSPNAEPWMDLRE